MSLKYKIALVSNLLILVLLFSTLYIVKTNFDESIAKKIDAQFENAKTLYTVFNQTQVDILENVALYVNFASNFKENVKTERKADIKQAISETWESTHQAFDLMIVLRPNFHSITSNLDTTLLADSTNLEQHPAIQDLFIEKIPDYPLRTLLLKDSINKAERLFLVYAVDISNEAGTLGYVIIGKEINNGYADNINKSLNTGISFFAKQTVFGTSLQKQKRLSLEDYIKTIPDLKMITDMAKNTSELVLGDESSRENFLISFVELDKAINSFFVLTVSKDELYKDFAGIQSLFIMIAIGSVLLASILSYLFGNTITKPINKLALAVQEIEKENYNTKVDISSKDEIGLLAKTFNEMTQGLGERFELLKFVSKNTLSMIQKKGVGNLSLGGERKHMTMFFSDIRGFTSFSEKRQPEEVIEMLNLYLRKQAEIVQIYGGDIDKFVGDELMATFEGADGETRSVKCAQEIQKKMNDLNKELKNDIYIGIGINAGEVISGNMGSENRIDHTVLGNNVNLAARLCSKAERMQIIVSQSVYDRVEDKQIFLALEAIEVKGISKPVPIFQVNY